MGGTMFRKTVLLAAVFCLMPTLAHAVTRVVCVSETKQREIIRFSFDVGRKVVLSGGFDDQPFPANQPMKVTEDAFTWQTKMSDTGTVYNFNLDRSPLC